MATLRWFRARPLVAARQLIRFTGLPILVLTALNLCWAQPSEPSAVPDSSRQVDQRIDEIVAVVNGSVIKKSEIDRLIRVQLQKLYNDIYRLRLRALDRTIVDMLMAKSATEKGLSLQEFYEGLLSDVEISKEEIMAFEATYSGDSLALDRLEALRRFTTLELQKRKGRILKERVEALKNDADIKIFLRPDRLALVDVGVDDDPSKGPEDAPITIVEFADFRCSHCRRMQPVLNELLSEFPNEIRLVFRDFPVNNQSESIQAAMAAECARDQGKFWPFHDLLFQHQGPLNREALVGYARELDIATGDFETCLDSAKYRLEISQDKADARAAGVTGTPSFFINGHFVPGASELSSLREIVRRELRLKNRSKEVK